MPLKLRGQRTLPTTSVLLADDDVRFFERLTVHLEGEGFGMVFARSGKQALRLARAQPAVALLNASLPDLSGIEICRRLRSATGTRSVPIILLGAGRDPEERVRGLDAGADDYIDKPFSHAELVARIKALVRRSPRQDDREMLWAGDIEMDVENYKVRRAGRRIRLGATEFRLLRLLMENQGRMLSREQLIGAVWAHNPAFGPNSVNVFIRRLRKSLNAEGELDPIRTIRSIGYSLDFDA